MAQYSVHFLNREKQIVRLAVLECESDQEASRKAAALVDTNIIELWRDNKRLGRFNPNAPRTAASGSAQKRKVDTLVDKGLALHRAGELSEAVKQYSNVLRVDNDNARALTLLGTLQAQRGNLDKAVALLKRSLEIDPRQDFAFNSLGNALNSLGRHDEALAAFDKSLALKPGQATTYSNGGNALRGLKRNKEALAAYRTAIKIDPDYPEAHSNRGDLLRELKRYDDAVASYDKALALRPDSARDWFSRAVALQDADRPKQALESYDRAIALKPGMAEAWNNRGNALATLQRYDEAIGCYREAIKRNAAYAAAYNNWGNALRGLRRFQEAIDCYRRASALKSDYADAHTNLGLVLLELGHHEDAIASFDSAIRITPDDAQVHNSKGNALRGLRKYREACASYNSAIECKPDYAAAYYNRGLVLERMGRVASALTSYDFAITHAPEDAGAYFAKAIVLRHLKRFDEALSAIDKAVELDREFPYALGERLAIKLRMCDWNGLAAASSAVTSSIGLGSRTSVPFSIIAIEGTPSLQRQCAEIYVRDKYPQQTLPAIASADVASGSTKERIRVAYLSADFRAHATAYLMAGMLEQHDRSRFEVYAISFGKSDGSEMRARVEKGCEHFIDACDQSDREVATLLREQEIDIAVDLKGFTRDARSGILAFRPAPIQVNYLGYPGTMGAGYIDYLIADKIVVPQDAQASYSENIVYLPDTYQCNDSKRAMAHAALSRSDAGLPETGFVFCSFNNNYKITPEIFDIWMRLLKATEGSVLWLLESNPAAARNLRREAEARGVAPERLVFAPFALYADHLARIPLADLFLDTLPCCAHTTASDALWSGVPVLTCLGDTFAGRVAASLLHAIGLPDMVTYSPQEYEARALGFAHAPSALAAVKAKLARNRTTQPLFDTVRFTRHLEAAYTSMVERHRSGEPPAGFAVASGAADVQKAD